MLTKIKNISKWLETASNDKKERQRREAIHTLLDAIASSKILNAKMAMKGGVLLAIKYSSSRYTIDVDFSTSLKASEINTTIIQTELNKQLTISSERLNYGMVCLIQKFKKEPNNPEATTPTFRITVGYAYKSDRNNYRALQKKRSSTVIKIDYSLNEIIHETEELFLTNGKSILTYGYFDLISEKYRALLQQETRNRWRDQDVYDLYYVLTNFGQPNKESKKKILKLLIEKSASRGLNISKQSIAEPEVRKRAMRDYEGLGKKIFGELPKFDTAFQCIKKFYECLPWED